MLSLALCFAVSFSLVLCFAVSLIIAFYLGAIAEHKRIREQLRKHQAASFTHRKE